MSRRLLGLTVALVVLAGAATGWAQTNLTVVRHSDNTLWKMTCNGTSDCSAWTQFGGGFSNQPTLTWDQILNKYILIGIGNNQSNIWRSTFNEDGTWNNDWTLIGTGATGSPSPVAASGAYYDTLGELTTCGVGQIPKWSGSAWACAADDVGAGLTPSSTVTPLDGTAAAGSSSNYSRGDHKHGISNNSITSGMIADGTIVNADISASAAIDFTKLSGVAAAVHNHDAVYVNEGQTDSLTTTMIQAGAVTDVKITGPISGSKISATGLNADTLDGQHADAFAATSHNHDSRYVNETGDTMTGNLRLISGGAESMIYTGNDSRLSFRSNNTAVDSRSSIELWGNDATRAGELRLAGTYIDMIYGSTDTSAGNFGMRLTSGGNLGIGHNAPSEKLTVEGNLLVDNGTAGKSLRLRTTADALDFDIHGHNLYVNGDSGFIMFIDNAGKKVGIGTDDPGANAKLDVVNDIIAIYGTSTGNGAAGAFKALGPDSWGVYGYGTTYDFNAGGPGTNYGPFTGGHDVKLSSDLPTNILPGMIVSVTGEAQVRRHGKGEISLSSTLPTVTLSKKPQDKAVFGVFVKEAALDKGDKKHWYNKKDGERFGVINALGEGRVWVSNINGNIEAGDYITTSGIPGYGQRQDDDLLHSYTLGKAIETVDWDSVTETVQFEGQLIKVYLIAIVYTSG